MTFFFLGERGNHTLCWLWGCPRFSGADIAAWPDSVNQMCKFSAFLDSLHWPAGAHDMGFGVSYLEIFILL